MRRLRLRLLDHCCELLLAETVGAANVDAVTGGDGADAVLGVPGVADLADGDNVQWGLEDPRDFRRDLPAAPRKPDDDELWPALALEPACERLARFASVAKKRGG